MVRKMLPLVSVLLVAALALSIRSSAEAQTPAPAQAAAAAGTTKLTEWDYYTAGTSDAGPVWGNLLTQCGTDNNITVDRQSVPRNELISKVLLAAQQQQLPDVLMIDNPDLQQLANTGALAVLPHNLVHLTTLQ